MSAQGDPRRRRPTLDRDVIIDAAVRLAATSGVDALSFRKLGVELGADHTAVYRHFTDRDDLVRAAIDRLQARVREQVPMDAPWRERLRTVATLMFRICLQHPAIGAEIGQHTTGGDGEREGIELMLGAFQEAGLNDDDVMRFYGVFSGHVLSVTGATVSYLLATTSAGKAEDPLWIGELRGLDEARFPLMTRFREPLEHLELEEVYTAGVEVILQAAAATAAAYREG